MSVLKMEPRVFLVFFLGLILHVHGSSNKQNVCHTRNVFSRHTEDHATDIQSWMSRSNGSTFQAPDPADAVPHGESNNQEVSPKLRELLERWLPLGRPALDREAGLCGDHSRIAKEAALRLEHWALTMFDSSAKWPSGVLNGNINQLGDFDQCLRVSHEVVKTQYCLAFLEVRATPSAGPRLRRALRLVHSHHAIRSNVTDPGHRIPRYTSLSWAVCAPASCSAEQLQRGLSTALAPLSELPELSLHVTLQRGMCYHKQHIQIDVATALTCALFAIILGTIFIATIVDINSTSEKPSTTTQSRGRRALLAFSLRRSWRRLVSTNAPKDDVSAMHGVRFLNAFGLIMCHKSIALFFDPFVNRTEMSERLTHPWTVIGRTAILYTDSFILMSGLLVAYSLVPELDRTRGRLALRSKYTSRFLRIVPNLAAIILFCTYVMQMLGSGPQWSVVVQHYSDMCKQYMWRNFLFIHNFFGFEEMCLTHTHQLGIDMQLYLVSPLLVYVLWRWPRAGLASLISITGLSAALRYVVTLDKQLSSIVYFGMTVRRMFDTAKYSYILPTHRATSYILGIFLGYYLRRHPEGLTLSKGQTALAWTVTGVSAAVPWFIPIPASSWHFQYDPESAALYAALYPFSWCTFIAGLILLSHKQRGGYIGVFLRWRGFLIFTRLAYAVYLTQFPIFFYNIGTRRHASFSSTADLINIPELLAVGVASLLLTLIIDLPFQELKRVLTEKKAPPQKSVLNAPEENCAAKKIESSESDIASWEEKSHVDPHLIRRVKSATG